VRAFWRNAMILLGDWLDEKVAADVFTAMVEACSPSALSAHQSEEKAS
jgi:hypothetical protein